MGVTGICHVLNLKEVVFKFFLLIFAYWSQICHHQTAHARKMCIISSCRHPRSFHFLLALKRLLPHGWHRAGEKRREERHQWWHWPTKRFAAAGLFTGDYSSVLIKEIVMISLEEIYLLWLSARKNLTASSWRKCSSQITPDTRAKYLRWVTTNLSESTEHLARCH